MVNQIAPKMMIIDTPGATPLWNTRVKIGSITHGRIAAAGNRATVTDQNGVIIFDHVASEANDIEQKYINDWFNGLAVPTLSGGVVEIILA